MPPSCSSAAWTDARSGRQAAIFVRHSPAQRLETLRLLCEAGVPAGVLVAPAITDHEIPALLAAARQAGATHAGYVMLRLPHAVAPLFESCLEEHVPDRKDKVLYRLQAMRGGALYQSAFGERMRGTGFHADQVAHLFSVMHRKLGFETGEMDLRTQAFRPAGGAQLEFISYQSGAREGLNDALQLMSVSQVVGFEPDLNEAKKLTGFAGDIPRTTPQGNHTLTVPYAIGSIDGAVDLNISPTRGRFHVNAQCRLAPTFLSGQLTRTGKYHSQGASAGGNIKYGNESAGSIIR